MMIQNYWILPENMWSTLEDLKVHQMYGPLGVENIWNAERKRPALVVLEVVETAERAAALVGSLFVRYLTSAQS
jgi:hypothetical protein